MTARGLPVEARAGYRGGVSAPEAEERRFEVVAWMADRRMVLYVPAIEAATSVRDMTEADDAARGLIADLTGLEPVTIRCDIRVGRAGGLGHMGGGPVGYAD
ncbi:hypothetical protein GCM10023403_35240 [Pseudonocardia benzenivorans]|uniref:Uncharacterized protein n=1 Tax=Pseudonocardia dioxanivorans (strain ATCC 55486 / DSM 44775 / JCM 13855 / CB1190) TaxID=675635 RepID=F4D0T8_PSEUX|nr:hypothetical protein Psed_3619 [Pseudonocardia dioxanivorans CB1190]GJF06451.1 hypothetical protein PSD17_53980 [Pseudonocardia sp. D17]